MCEIKKAHFQASNKVGLLFCSFYLSEIICLAIFCKLFFCQNHSVFNWGWKSRLLGIENPIDAGDEVDKEHQ